MAQLLRIPIAIPFDHHCPAFVMKKAMKILIVGGVEPLVSAPSLSSLNVTLAQNEAAARKKIINEDFDFILLDLDSLESDSQRNTIIADLRKIKAEIKIVVICSYNSFELEKVVRKQGALSYLIKPINMQYLEAIANHLALKTNMS